MSRKWMTIPGVVGVVAAVCLFSGLLAAGIAQSATSSLPTDCAQATSTVTCTYPAGTTATFTVPADVSQVQIKAVGGTGGGSFNNTADGGEGAIVTTPYPVSQGDTLTVTAATNGTTVTQEGQIAPAQGGSGGSVGNSEASGGSAQVGSAPGPTGSGGGGGGGASTVALNSASLPIVVAAGGGGAGCSGTDSAGPATGGNAGTQGSTAGGSYDGGYGGAGTSSGGGSGGSAPIIGAGSGGPGDSGGVGGGDGGVGQTAYPYNGGGCGGGGGGGYYGGGGGAGGSDLVVINGEPTFTGWGGGGGGGASFGGTVSLDTTATPEVVISYNLISFTASAPPAGVVGTAYSYQYAAAGDSDYTYARTAGTLPPGLTLSNTGQITGTPTTTGTYTFTVTATGATASASTSSSITVAAALTATVAGVAERGATDVVSLTCQGPPGKACQGTASATASGVLLGSGTFAVPVGKTGAVDVALNAAGKALLDKSYVLHTALSFTGVPVASTAATFSYPLVSSPPTGWLVVTWLNKPCKFCWTSIKSFKIPGLLATATVKVTCHGTGCPRSEKIGPGQRSANLTKLFAGHRLGARSVIEVEITAPEAIGREVTFTAVAASLPHERSRCLPPGAKKPLVCA